MSKQSYYEKLKDPRWQKKRLEILDRDKFTCQMCEATDMTLHVHHKYYVTGREPWEYPDCALVTLCEQCHDIQGDRDHPYGPQAVKFWETVLGDAMKQQPDFKSRLALEESIQ